MRAPPGSRRVTKPDSQEDHHDADTVANSHHGDTDTDRHHADAHSHPHNSDADARAQHGDAHPDRHHANAGTEHADACAHHARAQHGDTDVDGQRRGEPRLRSRHRADGRHCQGWHRGRRRLAARS